MRKSILTMFIPFVLWGQNLDELVQLSLKNQLVDSYRYDTQAIQKEYESLKSSYYPSLDLNSKYAHANKESASTPKKGLTNQASINLIVYDGNKKQNSFKKYENSIKSSTNVLASTKNQITLEVTSYYYNYLAFLAKKEAKIKEIEQLKAQEQRLTRFLDVGTATKDEVEKIISRVQSQKVNLHEIELDLQTILFNLEYLTGAKVSITKGSSIENIAATNSTNRADIKALEYEVKALLDNARIQKSENLPTVTLDNTYSRYDYDYSNSSYDTFEDQNILSLNMKWNLYSFGETKNKYEAAYKKYLSLKSKYEYEKNKANTALNLAQKAYDIAKLKIEASKASLKAANSAYEVIKSKYENGLIQNVAYLESLSEKYEAISQLQFAKYDLEIKKANIIYHSGEELKDYIR